MSWSELHLHVATGSLILTVRRTWTQMGNEVLPTKKKTYGKPGLIVEEIPEPELVSTSSRAPELLGASSVILQPHQESSVHSGFHPHCCPWPHQRWVKTRCSSASQTDFFFNSGEMMCVTRQLACCLQTHRCARVGLGLSSANFLHKVTSGWAMVNDSERQWRVENLPRRQLPKEAKHTSICSVKTKGPPLPSFWLVVVGVSGDPSQHLKASSPGSVDGENKMIILPSFRNYQEIHFFI